MNINIYYGGRGIIDDPTLAVLDKMAAVLEELRVVVKRYNLYEYKNTIPTLPQTLKDADGVVLASTVEWHGVGGYMHQFLDACWQFGDKEKISGIYMMPVVMSRTFGEREARMDLVTAWELLGGRLIDGFGGYIENTLEIEMNAKYRDIIEKKTENLYRAVNQKIASFPSSATVLQQTIALPASSSFSPQESEQLSQYVSDDHYVQTQKEDIQELASMFRDIMGEENAGSEEEYLGEIKRAFRPQVGVAGSFSINIEEKAQNLVLKISGTSMTCGYGSLEKPDVEMEMTRSVMDEIVGGRMTFQRAFMSGAMKKMKGDFRILCGLDQVLNFVK